LELLQRLLAVDMADTLLMAHRLVEAADQVVVETALSLL
jgi:hypothetical protein